jgi:hypothetical protein
MACAIWGEKYTLRVQDIGQFNEEQDFSVSYFHLAI